jgi:hypothetical protein
MLKHLGVVMGKKNTLLAWSDMGVSTYAAAKTRKISTGVSRIESSVSDLKELSIANMSATFAVYELLASQGEELRDLSSKMRDYNDTLEDIRDHYDETRQKELITGKRRVLVLGIKKELDLIENISQNSPEFGALQLEHLRDFIDENKICITNFQHTSFDELQQIDEVLSSVDKMYDRLINSLRESDRLGLQ